MTKNSFVLQTRLKAVVAKLSDKQAGVLLKSILDYADDGTVANLDDGMVAVVFEMVKQDLDYTAKKYAETCARRAESGKLGGLANASKSKQMLANASKCYQKQAKDSKAKHNDNDVDVDNESDINISFQKESKEKVSRFIKPTVEEIRSYCESRKNGIDANVFFDFYESKGWKVGNSPMKNWQAAVNTWERRKKQEATNGTDYNKQPESDKYVGFGRKIGD